MVASPENASVERKSYNGSDVGSVDGALCRMPGMVATNVGMVVGVAGVCGVLDLPFLDEGVDSVDQTVLGNRVEEANQAIIGGM